jgi:hypothetical protein
MDQAIRPTTAVAAIRIGFLSLQRQGMRGETAPIAVVSRGLL